MMLSLPNRTDKRRAKNGLRKTHDLIELRALHHHILRLKLAGLKHRQIADKLGCTPATVNYTVNSTLGKEKLSIMNGAADAGAIDFDAEIKELIGPALKVYDDILNGDSAPIQLKKATADTIIKDIAGRVAPKQINAKHIHAHINQEDLAEFKRRGYEAAVAAGVVADE